MSVKINQSKRAKAESLVHTPHVGRICVSGREIKLAVARHVLNFQPRIHHGVTCGARSPESFYTRVCENLRHLTV